MNSRHRQRVIPRRKVDSGALEGDPVGPRGVVKLRGSNDDLVGSCGSGVMTGADQGIKASVSSDDKTGKYGVQYKISSS